MQLENSRTFTITDEGKKVIQKSISSFKRSIFLVTPLFILVNYLIAYRVVYDSVSIANTAFWLVFIPLSIISSFFTIFFPLKAINRYQSIVAVINQTNDYIEIISYSGDKIVLSRELYKINLDHFRLKNQLSESIMICNQNKSYSIVESLFKEYSVIKAIMFE
ncbi:hypothetical protein B0I27_1084 [Arcticibacter pallidicorallinus]|uniref:Uncharacterized protein n=1 Tax=Arcticibacter pallidicorallinus TaxID=1259464 RepID=A0A2T0TYT5_9SPHI|nr:hypothetical protein [Arcticibacter pallidicorallinus]PRY50800.1 hypothetical protein B0I27_1084 [Arcticibacter pallidicorallinus]